jgi:type IV secretion system protein VirD4
MKNQPVGLPSEAVRSAVPAKAGDLRILGIATLSFVGVCLFVSTVATQWLAYRFNYQQALGSPLFGRFYSPFSWLVWSHKYYDNATPDFNRVYLCVIVALGLLFLGYAVWFTIRGRRSQSIDDLHGSAHWAKREEIERTGLLPTTGKPGSGVYVGAWQEPKGPLHYLRHNGPEHILAFAPSRSGKGVSLVVPTLLSWPESSVVFDLKGENWALSSGWRRAEGHAVLAFDPTDTQGRGVGYNPLEEVRIGTEYEIADAQNIVQQIIDPDGKGLESHWDKTSFMFLVGVVLYTIHQRTHEKSPTVASLADVAETLSSSAGIDQLYARMKGNAFGEGGAPHPVIARAAIDMLEKEPRERGSVLSTAKTFFALYADPVVARNIAKSGFKISDLMNSEKPVTLYLIVDPTNKARLKPLVRLVLTQIVRNLTPRLQFRGGQPVQTYKHRLLLMLDEFPSLGRLPIFEDALAHLAGYGIKAYLITQDTAQLAAAYGKDEAIMSNCHVKVAFAPNKVETANLLSSMTGTATVVKRQVSTSGQRAAALLGHVSESLQEYQRPLLTPDECMRLPGAKKDGTGRITEAGDMLVFAAGFAPIYGKQPLYFIDPTFQRRAAIPAPPKSDVLRP